MQQNQIYQQIPAAIVVATTIPPPISSGSNTIYQSSLSNNNQSSGIYASSTLRRQHPQQMQPLPKPPNNDNIEVPSSNSVDSAMYERDKQIYKCSTLRQGGKFDPKYKPSILNCPLPEIPKDSESPKKGLTNKEVVTANHYSKTLQRPPMKLPPQVKAIPPPRIDAQKSPPKGAVHVTNGNGPTQIPISTSADQEQHPPPPPSLMLQPGNVNEHSKPPPPLIGSPPSNGMPNGQTQINTNDESNYAVTEL